MSTIYTIGYGNRKIASFINLLKEQGLDVLVDIRRFPKSKIQGFNREELEDELSRSGITYIFMGDELGGFRRGGYKKHMETEKYREGICKLIELAGQGNVVIMCTERSPKVCHRRYIIQSLEEMDVKVINIE
ncbi:MAG: DUF488 domain-containing protein [Candidatus Bathyarchaeia archaeon]